MAIKFGKAEDQQSVIAFAEGMKRYSPSGKNAWKVSEADEEQSRRRTFYDNGNADGADDRSSVIGFDKE